MERRGLAGGDGGHDPDAPGVLADLRREYRRVVLGGPVSQLEVDLHAAAVVIGDVVGVLDHEVVEAGPLERAGQVDVDMPSDQSRDDVPDHGWFHAGTRNPAQKKPR